MTRSAKRRSGSHEGRGSPSTSRPLGLPGAWTPASAAGARRADQFLGRAAIAAIVLYGIYWAVQAFTLHRLGNYAVETDFYWKYGPAAAALKQGRVLIEHFDSTGWG